MKLFRNTDLITSGPLPHIRFAVLLLTVACAACAGGAAPNGSSLSQADCLPHFPDKDGWLGGDSAYSLALSNTASLWFFGDSFIATEDGQDRSQAAFVANSVGISTCTDGYFEIDYFHGGSDQTPGDFFGSADRKITYWPLSSFLHDGRLYVFLERVKRAKKAGPFEFEIVGVDLAIITNPNASPDEWTVRYRSIYEGRALIPGVAAVKQGHFVYLYSLRHAPTSDNRDILLQRLRLTDLSEQRKPMKLWTYLKGGTWTDETTPSDAAPVMRNGATEMSLRYLPEVGRWLAVMPAKSAFASHAEYRTSPKLSGPWRNPEKLAPYAEVADDGESGSSVFCYAAKEHGQFSRGKNAVLTYVCNTTDDSVAVRNDLYRPVPLRVKLPSLN